MKINTSPLTHLSEEVKLKETRNQSGSFGLVKEDGKNFPLSYVLMFERYHPI
jgi:hypothetical protein